MIVVVWRVSCSCWKVRRKQFLSWSFLSCVLIYLNRQDLRGQVLQERDSARNISLQKDIELKELQHRLDKNVRISLLSTRKHSHIPDITSRSQSFLELEKLL